MIKRFHFLTPKIKATLGAWMCEGGKGERAKGEGEGLG